MGDAEADGAPDERAEDPCDSRFTQAALEEDDEPGGDKPLTHQRWSPKEAGTLFDPASIAIASYGGPRWQNDGRPFPRRRPAFDGHRVWVRRSRATRGHLDARQKMKKIRSKCLILLDSALQMQPKTGASRSIAHDFRIFGVSQQSPGTSREGM